MAVRWTWRAVVLIAFVASSGPIWAQAQRPDDLDALSRQVLEPVAWTSALPQQWA